MTNQMITSTFTDSDGDTFKVANICRDISDDGDAYLAFTVLMNGKPTETMEWLAALDDGSSTEDAFWILCNDRHTIGREASYFVLDYLRAWLSENRQVAEVEVA